MSAAPNLILLRRLARDRGQVIIKSSTENLYAIVTPDNAGKRTDPRGERGAALAFAEGAGMSLQEVADSLGGRAD